MPETPYRKTEREYQLTIELLEQRIDSLLEFVVDMEKEMKAVKERNRDLEYAYEPD